MDAYGRQEPARKNGTESEGAGFAVVSDRSCAVCRSPPTVCSLGNVGRRCRVGTKGRQCRRNEVSDLGDSVIRQFVGHSSRDGLLAAVAIFVGEGAGNDMGQACQLFAEIDCLSLLPFSPRLGSFGGRARSDCATSYYGVNGKANTFQKPGTAQDSVVNQVSSCQLGCRKGTTGGRKRNSGRYNLPFSFRDGAGEEAYQRKGGGGSSAALENAFSTFSVMRETLLS